MASKPELQRVLDRLSNRSALDGVREELERRQGRSISLNEVQSKVDRLRTLLGSSNLQNISETGSRARGVSFAKAVPEEVLSPEQRQRRQAREELGKRAGQIEDIQNLSIEDLRLAAQKQPEQQEDRQGISLLQGLDFPRTAVGFGTDFLQSLLSSSQPKQARSASDAISGIFTPEQRQTLDQELLGSQVSSKERQLRDEAALAISKGADPVQVQQRLNKILSQGQ